MQVGWEKDCTNTDLLCAVPLNDASLLTKNIFQRLHGRVSQISQKSQEHTDCVKKRGTSERTLNQGDVIVTMRASRTFQFHFGSN